MMNREAEIEHFGFTPEQSCLERKYFLQKIISNALDAMVSKLNVNEKTSEMLREARNKVFENIWTAMKDERESLDDLDETYFTVPDHVLLPQYFDHVKSYTEQNELELDKELEVVKKTFLENFFMLSSLNLENTQYKSLSTFIDSEVEIHQTMDSFNSDYLEKIRGLVNKLNESINN